MSLFIARRLLSTVPVLLFVAVFVFLILRLTPGDPAALIVGDMGTEADIAAVRQNLGLDGSLLTQMLLWFGEVLRGNLGESYYLRLPVVKLIAMRLEPTLSLAALTIVMAVAMAVPLGVMAAAKRDSWLDRALMGFSVMGFSVPVFVLGYSLSWVLAVKGGLLPVQGYARLERGIGPWLQHLLLPAFTLSLAYLALIARVTRAAVVEALTEDYIRTARAKGLPEFAVLVRHALANAAVPIVTVIGIGISLLIGGVVVTETVFALPGLGQLTVDAVLARDFPVIQGVILLFSVAYVVINLLVDLSYVVFDPRIRY